MADKYRKKPIVIEAYEWFRNGDHPKDYAKERQGLEAGELKVFTAAECKAKGWEGEIVRYFRRPDTDGNVVCECGARMHVHGWIDTLEGGHRVCPGDWIITGIAGENYPCKPQIFYASYERVQDA